MDTTKARRELLCLEFNTFVAQRQGIGLQLGDQLLKRHGLLGSVATICGTWQHQAFQFAAVQHGDVLAAATALDGV